MKKIILSLLLVLFSLPCWAGVQDGLVGWWRLDEISGNAKDSIKGNTAIPTGTSILSACPRAGCRNFTGPTNYLVLTSSISLTGPMSVFAWVKVPSTNTMQPSYGGGVIFSYTASSCKAGDFFLSVNSGGRVLFTQCKTDGDTTAMHFSYSGGIGTFDQWNLIGATSDGTNTGIDFYLNGVRYNNDSNTNPSGWAVDKVIGRIYDSPGYYFQGSIDDVRVYNRKLTTQEVLDLYRFGAKFNQ